MNVFEMIGPVMIGPSSSHTAGAARLGKVARIIFAKKPVYAHIGMYGSFANTGKGHGTDKAIIAGILGMEPDDPRLKEVFHYSKSEGLEWEFEEIMLENAHPNTARITLRDEHGESHTIEGASIGGGSIKITYIDGYALELGFEIPTLLIKHIDAPGVIASVTDALYKSRVNICNFTLSRQRRGGEALMSIGMDNSPRSHIIETIKKLPHIISVDMLEAVS